MASNTYGRYYENDSFIISNCFLEEYDRMKPLPPEAFANPPLKMNVLKCEIEDDPDGGIEGFHDDASWYYNHPEFTENYLQILRGELENWKMAVIGIGIKSSGIAFATNRKPVLGKEGKFMRDGHLDCYAYGEITLLFEMDFQDGLPPILHKVEYVNK